MAKYSVTFQSKTPRSSREIYYILGGSENQIRSPKNPITIFHLEDTPSKGEERWRLSLKVRPNPNQLSCRWRVLFDDFAKVKTLLDLFDVTAVKIVRFKVTEEDRVSFPSLTYAGDNTFNLTYSIGRFFVPTSRRQENVRRTFTKSYLIRTQSTNIPAAMILNLASLDFKLKDVRRSDVKRTAR